MLKFKELCGELTMTIDDNVVIAQFSGAIDTKLAQHFIGSVEALVAPLNGQVWGYVSCSESVDAATPDAEALFVSAVGRYVQLGCRASAFVLTSPIAIRQMDRVLKRAGLEDGLTDRLFPSKQEAIKRVKQLLKGMNA